MNHCKECLGCRRRFIGCHGRNKDGSWRCGDWGKAQETAEQLELEKKAGVDISGYKYDVVGGIYRRHKAHHK